MTFLFIGPFMKKLSLTSKVPLLTVLWLLLMALATLSCKQRRHSSDLTENGTPTPSCDTRDFYGDYEGPIPRCLIRYLVPRTVGGDGDTLFLGMWQPDGSIYYFPEGMNRLSRVIWNILQLRSVEGGVNRTVRDDASGKQISYQLSRHILPAEIIPVGLWKSGIYWSYFVIPSKAFEPDTVYETYWNIQKSEAGEGTLTSEEVHSLKQAMPLYRALPITFQRFFTLYKRTYELDVMVQIRNAVTLDASRQEAASTLLSAERALLQSATGAALQAASSILFAARQVPTVGAAAQDLLAKAFYRRAFDAALSATASAVKETAYALMFVLAPDYIEGRFREAELGDYDYLNRLYRRDATAMYGISGIRIQNQNTAAYNDLVALRDIYPALASFIQRPQIRNFLLDPIGTYAIGSMRDILRRGDREFLAALKSNTSDTQKMLLDRLESNARASGLTFRRDRVSDFLQIGMRSPLFNEIMTAVLAKKPRFTLVVVDRFEQLAEIAPNLDINTPGAAVGFNRDQTDWVAVVDDLNAAVAHLPATGWESFRNLASERLLRLGVTSKDRLHVYTIAHEMWHKLRGFNLSGVFRRFANLNEFVQASSTDEMVALMVGKQVRDELLGTGGFQSSLVSMIERANIFSFETQLSLHDPEYVMQTTIMPALYPRCVAYITNQLGDNEIR